MDLKIKNYVVLESKTFTYSLKGINKEILLDIFTDLLRCNYLFDFRSNAKSNTLSFPVRTLDDFNNIKKYFIKRNLIFRERS